MNDLENKIKNFFESIDCSVEYFLKNKEKNPIKKTFLGKKVEIPPYTIIYDGKGDIMRKEESYKKIIDFINIIRINEKVFFDVKYIYLKKYRSVKSILNKLKKENYEIIFENKE